MHFKKFIFKHVVNLFLKAFIWVNTPDRWQSNTLLMIDERGSKIARNSVFDCQLSPVGRQMAIGNSVSNDMCSTFVDSSNVFDCLLSGVVKCRIIVRKDTSTHVTSNSYKAIKEKKKFYVFLIFFHLFEQRKADRHVTCVCFNCCSVMS